MRTLALAAILAAAPASAAPIDEVIAALAATSTMRASFVQTAADGSLQRGTMVLARPGRIRFEYAKSPILVVADGSRLTFVDYEVGQVSQWPVRKTPLGVLLDPKADLTRYARVVAVDGPNIAVEARDPKRPDFGAITLGFRRDGSAPGGLALTGWVALDAQNNLTEVKLSDVRYNVPVGGGAFRFRDPRTKTPPGKAS